MSKVYVLLRNSFDANVGTEFCLSNNGLGYNYTTTLGKPKYITLEFVENNPEWFAEKKEEIKSNDSFQWTDELVKNVCNLCHHDGWHKFGEGIINIINTFKQSHTPKPQAENKPDTGEYYTKEKAEAMERNAWYAARFGVGVTKHGTCYDPDVKFKTFQDYKNQKK